MINIKKWSVISTTPDLRLPNEMIVLGFDGDNIIAISTKSVYTQQRFSSKTIESFGDRINLVDKNGERMIIERIFKSERFLRNIKNTLNKGFI